MIGISEGISTIRLSFPVSRLEWVETLRIQASRRFHEFRYLRLIKFANNFSINMRTSEKSDICTPTDINFESIAINYTIRVGESFDFG